MDIYLVAISLGENPVGFSLFAGEKAIKSTMEGNRSFLVTFRLPE
jgi:hypothetical protein